MWRMAWSIARGNDLGDIGVSSEDEPELEITTKCSDPYVLLGFLGACRKNGANYSISRIPEIVVWSGVISDF